MVRKFLRILILIFGASLVYFWSAHSLELVGLLAILVLLSLFYLATYVKSIKQANDDDSLQTLVEDESLENSVKSYFEHTLGIDNPFREDKVGRKTFYPSGQFGRGFYIPDDATEKKIADLRLVSGVIAMTVGGIGVYLGSLDNPVVWTCVLIVLFMFSLWYRSAMRKILDGCEVIQVDSEHYSPPPFNRRYGTLALALLACGIVAGLGDMYNKGFSIVDVILAVGCTFLLGSYGYITWKRRFVQN